MCYIKIWAAAAEKGYVEPTDKLIPSSAESIALPTDVTWREMAAIAAETVAATAEPTKAKNVWARARVTKCSLQSALNHARKQKNEMLKNPDLTEEERQALIVYANDLIALGNRTLKQAEKVKVSAEPQKASPTMGSKKFASAAEHKVA